jgi:hypothetical protein
MPLSSNNSSLHATHCALLLLAFCLVDGMENSDFVLPLRQEFYMQNILIAIILGISVRMIIAARQRSSVASSDHEIEGKLFSASVA